MTPSTLKLHTILYRHLTGAVAAYAEWIKANQPPAELNPDPVKFFRQKDNQPRK